MSLLNDMLRDLASRQPAAMGATSGSEEFIEYSTKENSNTNWLQIGVIFTVAFAVVFTSNHFMSPEMGLDGSMKNVPVSLPQVSLDKFANKIDSVAAAPQSKTEINGLAKIIAATEFTATEFTATEFTATEFTATEFTATEFTATEFTATEFTGAVPTANVPTQTVDAVLALKISDLLLNARRALALGRLTSPIEDNAFGYYQKVLAIAPDDHQAKDGLNAISARYVEKAKQQKKAGELAQASMFMQRAQFVSPDYFLQHGASDSTELNTAHETLRPLREIGVATQDEPPSKIQSESIKLFEVNETTASSDDDPVSLSVAPNAQWKDEQLANYATELSQQGKTSEAVVALQKFVSSEQKPIRSVVLLAELYIQQGDTQAVDVLLNNTDYIPFVEKTRINAQLLMVNGDHVAAIKLLEERLTSAENNEKYQALLASLYHKVGQYQLSVVSYQRLLSRYGERPAYWLGLALAFDGLAQATNALQAYNRLREFPQLQDPVKIYIDKRIAALGSE